MLWIQSTEIKKIFLSVQIAQLCEESISDNKCI